MKKAVWLSFDFGIKGDYKGLYTWLDNHDAVECGEGLAFFPYHTEQKDMNLFLKEISEDIKKYVTLSQSDRLYIISKDTQLNFVRGFFINGDRKASPWIGFGRLKESGNSFDTVNDEP